MEGTIDRVEMVEDEKTSEITLNGKTPFGIIWKDGRSIFLFGQSESETAVQTQKKNR